MKNGRSGVPDHTTIEQTHAPAIPEVDEILRGIHPNQAGVVEVSRMAGVVVRDPDVKSADPEPAPSTRAPMVPQAFTVRPMGHEVDTRNRGEHGEIVPGVQVDPLQAMEDAGIARGNTFRVPPDPWDSALVE